MNWKTSAAALRWNIQPFIAAQYRPSKSAAHFNNVNPADETTLCEVAAGDPEDVDEAVRVARQRFEDGCKSKEWG